MTSKNFFCENTQDHPFEWLIKKITSSGDVKEVGTLYQIYFEGNVNLNGWHPIEVIEHLENEGLVPVNFISWYKAQSKAIAFGEEVANYVWDFCNNENFCAHPFEVVSDSNFEYSIKNEVKLKVYRKEVADEYYRLQQTSGEEAADWYLSDKYEVKTVTVENFYKGVKDAIIYNGDVICEWVGRLFLSQNNRAVSSPYFEDGSDSPKVWKVGESVTTKGNAVNSKYHLPEGYTMYSKI